MGWSYVELSLERTFSGKIPIRPFTVPLVAIYIEALIVLELNATFNFDRIEAHNLYQMVSDGVVLLF